MSSVNEASRSIGALGGVASAEVKALHKRCGVYTKPAVVKRILDAVDWCEAHDLSAARLLEPAAGNGEFIVEAARRLVAAFELHDIPLTLRTLSDRIKAFELHPVEARQAQFRVATALREMGLHQNTADACARSWIMNADFLLTQLPAGFTHAVGNPPYVRWSKIPEGLKASYQRTLSRNMTGGDLFLPILDRALEALGPGARCGFLCSDRWRFMAFAESFREKWLPRLNIASEKSVRATEAFQKNVDSYPTILIASIRQETHIKRPAPAFRRLKTLVEQGCVIKVGPALGHTPAFVLGPDDADVEPELLRPWIDGSEINEGSTSWGGRHVVTMNGADGELIELWRFPLLRTRLQRFRQKLAERSIVRNGAPWFRSIDRVCTSDWTRPKLLVPELAKEPRLAIDRSGAIPSHGVYAIFAPEDDVDAFYAKLRDGALAKALVGISPKVKGGYVRCYKRFLEQVAVR